VTEPLGLTVEEVAHLTGRHPYVIRRWIRDGALPAIKDPAWPHPYRIRAADLALIARRRRWGAKTPPAASVPRRLAAEASITGAARESGDHDGEGE
jgi:excisionase family DNA binding protein